jgi:hypothetical protein
MNREELIARIEAGETGREVLECLAYDAETGALSWLARPLHHFKSERDMKAWNTRYAGKKAGALQGQGYLEIRLGNKAQLKYKAHRIAWELYYGEPPGQQIDHINGDRTDNRICNLRCVTNQENAKNQKMFSNNTSGRTGVTWHKATQKWAARVRADGRHHHLGLFASFDDAVAAREAAELRYGFHSNHGRSDPAPALLRAEGE